MDKRKILDALWKLFLAGGWFPVLVFLIHLFFFFVVNIYTFWPRADVLLHFLGGLSIAYFVSRSWQLVRNGSVNQEWENLLELVLIISLTATAAVFWEFGEYVLDRTFNGNLQVNLLNTMQDLFMGMLGSFVVFIVRIWRLRVENKVVIDPLNEISC
jgi:hypothetical protein